MSKNEEKVNEDEVFDPTEIQAQTIIDIKDLLVKEHREVLNKIGELIEVIRESSNKSYKHEITERDHDGKAKQIISAPVKIKLRVGA